MKPYSEEFLRDFSTRVNNGVKADGAGSVMLDEFEVLCQRKIDIGELGICALSILEICAFQQTISEVRVKHQRAIEIRAAEHRAGHVRIEICTAEIGIGELCPPKPRANQIGRAHV